MTTDNRRSVRKTAMPVERGRWLKHGFLSHTFEVFTGRRVVNLHGDGTATFEVVGPKYTVDTASVLRAVAEYWEREDAEPK